jgi:hypothetical protein
MSLGFEQAGFDIALPLPEYMRINHGGIEVIVTHQFLDGSNIRAVKKQVRGERMPQGVASDSLDKSGGPRGVAHGVLEGFGHDMMPARLAGKRIDGPLGGRKNILPGPGFRLVRILLCEKMRHINLSEALGDIFVMPLFDSLQMPF